MWPVDTCVPDPLSLFYDKAIYPVGKTMLDNSGLSGTLLLKIPPVPSGAGREAALNRAASAFYA